MFSARQSWRAASTASGLEKIFYILTRRINQYRDQESGGERCPARYAGSRGLSVDGKGTPRKKLGGAAWRRHLDEPASASGASSDLRVDADAGGGSGQVADGIREVCDLEAKIKWPNDIVVNGKKVCGILTEMSTELECINYIVTGIGINVANHEFPEEIRDVATSLYLETGKEVLPQPAYRRDHACV